MGRLTRWRPAVGGAVLATCLLWLPARPAVAFTGFGSSAADATYGVEMTFEVDLRGGAPDRLELLLQFAGDGATFVAPATIDGERGSYRWDADRDHVTPNTRITYRWRATSGDAVSVSPPDDLLYDDDRAGLDWQTARIGEATVHWYGDAATQARRFGELTADGAARAEATLGHELAGPVDIFVYDSQEEFFGALGPGAREWTGAAAYPELRTVFMWLGGGDQAYLETAIVHEVTHVVFSDATDNPFHEPARWLNEGFATWSEQQDAGAERSLVEFEADDGLFAFPAISEQFPIGDRGARLAYAQGAVMVDRLVDDHGAEAISRLTAAYRDGATDDQALAAAAGMPADELYGDFFAEFGVSEPQPVSPRPIPGSQVGLPGSSGGPRASGDAAPASPSEPNGTDGGAEEGSAVPVAALGLVVVVAAGAAAWWALRRRRAGA